MNWHWLHQPISERWKNILKRSGIVTSAIAVIILIVAIAPWLKLYYRGLPLGYSMGLFYAIISFSLVFICTNLKAYRVVRQRILQAKLKIDGKPTTIADALRAPWYVFVAQGTILLLLIGIFVPELMSSLGKLIVGFDIKSDLPWWHPQRTILLPTIVAGVLSIVGINSLNVVSPWQHKAKLSDQSGVKNWWQRDARILGAILLHAALIGVSVALYLSGIEQVGSMLPFAHDGFKTVVGAVGFLCAMYVVMVANRMRLILSRAKTSLSLRPDMEGGQSQKPVGMWDRELDHELSPNTRNVL